MNLCLRTVVVIRPWANLAAIIPAFLMVRAEQIQFSKPAVEIATPAKAEEFLPETSKRLNFDSPQIAPPVIMPQSTIIPRLPRPGEEDEDEERFPLRRTGRSEESGRRKFGDRFGDRDTRGRAMAPDDLFASRSRKDPFALEFPDAQRALSPVMDFNWDARETAKSRNYSPFGGLDPDDREERTDALKPSFSAGRPQEELSERSFQVARFSDWFGGSPKEKPSPDIVNRRAAFEQLLNPSVGVGGRAPGSLEPLPALEKPTLVPALILC